MVAVGNKSCNRHYPVFLFARVSFRRWKINIISWLGRGGEVEERLRKAIVVTRVLTIVLMCGTFVACASPQPSYVNPGMSRQEVIRSLGPPLYVTAKEEQGVEYLHYRVPPLESKKAPKRELPSEVLVDLVVPIHDGAVLSPDHPISSQ